MEDDFRVSIQSRKIAPQKTFQLIKTQLIAHFHTEYQNILQIYQNLDVLESGMYQMWSSEHNCCREEKLPGSCPCTLLHAAPHAEKLLQVPWRVGSLFFLFLFFFLSEDAFDYMESFPMVVSLFCSNMRTREHQLLRRLVMLIVGETLKMSWKPLTLQQGDPSTAVWGQLNLLSVASPPLSQ